MTVLEIFILLEIPASVLILAWGSVLMFERGAATRPQDLGDVAGCSRPTIS